MIRRISKHNDLKDYIKSCPSGVIDDINEIRYYIQGHPEYIVADFTKVGNQLVVILPTSQLETLHNGILMRRAFYKVTDTSYPDGYYNLEFEDCMNIWLGDYESEEPIIPEYVTEDELASTLSSYATQSWVSGQNYTTRGEVDYILNDYVTVKYLGDTLEPYATQSWVSSQNFASEQFVTAKIGELRESTNASISALNSAINDLSMMTRESFSVIDYRLSHLSEDYATKSWVASFNFATTSYVNSAVGEVTSLFRAETVDIRYGMSSMAESISALNEDVAAVSETCSALGEDISAIMNDMATRDDVDGVYSYIDEQGYATEQFVTDSLSEYATQEWVSENAIVYDMELYETIGYEHMVNLGGADIYIIREDGVNPGQYNGVYIGDLEAGYYTYTSEGEEIYTPFLTADNIPSGLATQSWVSSNFLSSGALSGYATEQFVTGSLSSYATQSWVESQSYLTSASISTYVTESAIESMGFATQSWVSSNFLSSVPSDYATKSWVSSNYLADSKVWCGTREQWDRLTSEEKATYKIALVTA